MEPCSLGDSPEVSSTTITDKGQAEDADQKGVGAEHEDATSAANLSVQERDMSDCVSRCPSRITSAKSTSQLSSGDMESNSEQCKSLPISTSSAKPQFVSEDSQTASSLAAVSSSSKSTASDGGNPQHFLQDWQNSLIDEDKAMSQSLTEHDPSDKVRVQRLKPSEQKYCHELNHDDSECKGDKKKEDKLNLSLELLLETLNMVADVDPFLVTGETMCDETFYETLNSDVSLSRKRSSSTFNSESIFPAKFGKFETLSVKKDIWSKMESLYKEQCSAAKYKMEDCEGIVKRDIKKTFAQGNLFCHTDLNARLKDEQVNGTFSLGNTLLNPKGFLDGSVLRQLAQQSGNCEHNRSEVEVDATGNRGKKDFSDFYGSCLNDSRFSDECWSHRWPLQVHTRSKFHYPRHQSRSSFKHQRRYKNRSSSRLHLSYRCSSRSSSKYSCRKRSLSRSCSDSSRSSSSSRSCSDSRSLSRSISRSPSRRDKSLSKRWLHTVHKLLNPLVLPSSVTTLIVAPVTGSILSGKGSGGSAGGASEFSNPEKASAAVASGQSESAGLKNSLPPNAGNKTKFDSKDAYPDASSGASTTVASTSSQSLAYSTVGPSKTENGNPGHHPEPLIGPGNHFGEHYKYNNQRDQSWNNQRYNHIGYHPTHDSSFSEDTGYENFEFHGDEYDQFYDEGQDEYSFNHESYHHLPQRPAGPHVHYPRRPIPQGFRGPPPQMYPPNDQNYGHPRPGMGPPPRMGLNGPIRPRGARLQGGHRGFGPRGHRPPLGPGRPLGPPGMRGPPRGAPYGPPGPMRPQGMRGPHGQVGPRLGPPPRMTSPMPRQNSPSGPVPRLGPPVPGPLPRDGQYPPPRSNMPPRSPGNPVFPGPVLNLSQPPPNFSAPPSSVLASSSATPSVGSNVKVTDSAEPPPLPPPKPPSPKPPPPPKKEEEKKEEVKPMTPLIPPEQAEQYRRLREQARKHAKKQLRKQEHQAKGEPESDNEDDEEEKNKRREYEAKLAAEQEEMEKVALLAAQDDGVAAFEEGATYYMPAPQAALVQQPTYVLQHHPMSTPPSSYGLMPGSHVLHAAHPALHASQLQNLQYMAAPAQAQLVQLPNGQMAYATPSPVTYQASTPMVAMPQPATAMPHHYLMSSAGMHQGAYPGFAVSGSQYMAHVMAAQAQAAQMQAAQSQAAQMQAAQSQAAQIQAAQSQAAQIHAAQSQAAQIQAAQTQAAQIQAAQVQQAQLHGYVPMAQHVIPTMHHPQQGQYILMPRVARPQM